MTRESKFVDFEPKWERGSLTQMEGVEDGPITGPRGRSREFLSVRLIPLRGGNLLGSKTIGEVLIATQRIVTYAAYEAVNGVRFDFSDLRQVGEPIQRLAQLELAPFERGSFVIPFLLSRESVRSTGTQLISAREVVLRLTEVMNGLAATNTTPFATSIGFLQAVEELGASLGRDTKEIEFRSRSEVSTQPIVISQQFISSVRRQRKERLDPQESANELTGRLIGVDVEDETFRIKVGGRIVRGKFGGFLRDSMVASLNQIVRLYGVVEYVGQKPVRMRAVSIEQSNPQ